MLIVNFHSICPESVRQTENSYSTKFLIKTDMKKSFHFFFIIPDLLDFYFYALSQIIRPFISLPNWKKKKSFINYQVFMMKDIYSSSKRINNTQWVPTINPIPISFTNFILNSSLPTFSYDFHNILIKITF